MLKQKTLRGSFSLNGKGLHTGVNLIRHRTTTGIKSNVLTLKDNQ